MWHVEHLLKDEEDFEAWINLPDGEMGEVDVSDVLAAEEMIGDAGIVMLDSADALCLIAGCFDMATFTIIGLTREDLMHRALEKVNVQLLKRVKAVSAALPGRLWRFFGPEYASPPYLPPRLFEAYVVRYITPLISAVKKHGGFPRIHSHGRLKDILDHIVATGCIGLDPVEPPPQGDVELSYVRERYGKDLVLFGNLEVSDIENLPTVQFERKIETALREGTQGEGRGFVLMPSAAPYGRTVTPRTLRNYERMVEMTLALGGK